ncbi:hypothetical protein AT2G32487 [Arabidopsis thaliana]|uniref:Uncharacterized protein n=1 Tax=Arabidopsis thaliana TaxID=3702 RepID=F4ITR7_ARATH|nr:uncharacterized protein AT2G32487 [Arabidopsis thaliana]NP_001324540.1 uncharacterized protein AT2G32487 [Arabidopsis thaliana]AEC08693.2 hypothetical protein AT2G32487 [Arabidopsis thaliana]ANM62379.1 hypothetical protein AT2G32487 [Arabidopsis thaliana]|eukprot:NP_001318336.1 hypothetical protein AT2G32487 [Arabidopsis thaliana]
MNLEVVCSCFIISIIILHRSQNGLMKRGIKHLCFNGFTGYSSLHHHYHAFATCFKNNTCMVLGKIKTWY